MHALRLKQQIIERHSQQGFDFGQLPIVAGHYRDRGHAVNLQNNTNSTPFDAAYPPHYKKIVNNWPKNIQTLLLPPRCLFCGDAGFRDLDICPGCFHDLQNNHQCCYRCGEHFDIANPLPQLCGRCLKNTPSFDETHAPFRYDSAMRHLITQLKFQRTYKNARLLAGLLAEHVAAVSEPPECIIPVPLHPNRYRERGFNQSLEIARHLGKHLAIPLDFESCIRSRDTAHQSELPAKQRRRNMKQAFDLVKAIDYRHVVIIDDVMTTGATVDALATALKHHGVARVDVWACARA
jgi:ComF family protein